MQSEEQENAVGIFSAIRITKENQAKLTHAFAEVFSNNIVGNELVVEIRRNISPDLFVLKEVQEKYEIYRIVWTKIGKREVKVPETHMTGLIIS